MIFRLVKSNIFPKYQVEKCIPYMGMENWKYVPGTMRWTKWGGKRALKQAVKMAYVPKKVVIEEVVVE